MRSGELRIRARLQTQRRVSDGIGGHDTQYVDVDTVSIGVRALSATERFQFAKIESAITHEVQLRHRDDLSADMRLVYDNTVLLIKGLMPDGRRRHITLSCEQIT